MDVVSVHEKSVLWYQLSFYDNGCTKIVSAWRPKLATSAVMYPACACRSSVITFYVCNNWSCLSDFADLISPQVMFFCRPWIGTVFHLRQFLSCSAAALCGRHFTHFPSVNVSALCRIRQTWYIRWWDTLFGLSWSDADIVHVTTLIVQKSIADNYRGLPILWEQTNFVWSIS